MNQDKDKISVVVPVYNAAKFIDETIKSVINQTYDSWELILVDDGSTDNSVEIIEKYVNNKNIFLLKHRDGINLGVSKTRELGVQNAQGAYIAFLDADDIFLPNKLSNQIEVFFKNEEVVLVHSKVEVLNNSDSTYKNEFTLDGKNKSYVLHEQDYWLKSNNICNSTVIIRKNIFNDIKFGLPQLFQFEDWLLWSLISRKGKFYYQNTPLIKYRLHDESATSAILKNKLIAPYSKIEYLISLYSHANSDTTNDAIVYQLNETLIQLLKIYSNNNFIKINAFRLDLSSRENTNNSYVEEYNQLSDKYLKLLNEYNEIKKIKKSRIYKVIRKIKNIIN